MLVTHSRMRGGKEAELFQLHAGTPRSLLVWDETLLCATGRDTQLHGLRRAVGALALDATHHPALADWLRWSIETIDADISAQSPTAPSRSGPPSVLRLFDSANFAAARVEAAALRPTHGDLVHAVAIDAVRDFIELAASPVSVALTGTGQTGDGMVRFTVDVPVELENISILDASHPVRLLGQVSVSDRSTAAMRDFKRYDKVRVDHFVLPASRSRTAGQKPGSAAAAHRVAELTADAIRAASVNQRVLVFTFKDDAGSRRTRRTPLTTLKKNLASMGIDLSARTPDKVVNGAVERGRLRVEFLTWGQETSLNDFADCEHIIIAGVLRRSPLDLAASYAGESNNLAARTSVRELSLSEMAHLILQAMHRGRCRRVDIEGQADAMALTLIDNEAGVRDLLEDLMPGVVWNSTKRLATGLPSRTQQTTVAIRSYLASLPMTTTVVSIRALKKAIGSDLARDGWRTALGASVAAKTLAGLGVLGEWVQEGSRIRRVVVRA